MKRIIELNGKKEALIEHQDIETLIESSYFVPEQIFKEPAIANMICDAEGYYHISEPANVEYIATIAFIPDYDYLASLSKEQLDALADKTITDKKMVCEIITKLCTCKEKLKRKEKRILKKASFLEPRCANWLEYNVLDASMENTMFRSMETALLAQARNYTSAILKMAEAPSMTEASTKTKKM